MNDLSIRIEEFFKSYEEANSDFDVERIAAHYAEVFMFAGSAGLQAVKKEDFVKVLPRRKEYFKLLGLVSSKIRGVDASSLDSKYSMAKVVWLMRFEREGLPAVGNENPATYVLSETNNRFEIILQIDHQDLATKIKDGFVSDAVNGGFA